RRHSRARRPHRRKTRRLGHWPQFLRKVSARRHSRRRLEHPPPTRAHDRSRRRLRQLEARSDDVSRPCAPVNRCPTPRRRNAKTAQLSRRRTFRHQSIPRRPRLFHVQLQEILPRILFPSRRSSKKGSIRRHRQNVRLVHRAKSRREAQNHSRRRPTAEKGWRSHPHRPPLRRRRRKRRRIPPRHQRPRQIPRILRRSLSRQPRSKREPKLTGGLLASLSAIVRRKVPSK